MSQADHVSVSIHIHGLVIVERNNITDGSVITKCRCDCQVITDFVVVADLVDQCSVDQPFPAVEEVVTLVFELTSNS